MLRRDFLAAGLAVVVPGAGALAGESGQSGEAGETDGTDAGQADRAVSARPATVLATPAAAAPGAQARYAALVDQDFLFYPGGRGVKLTLVRVIAGPAPAGSSLQQFSLVFSAATGHLASGLYEVDAPGMARQLMQVERLTGQGAPAQYRADFALL